MVSEIRGFNGTPEAVVLALAAGAELHSEHPVAHAVSQKAREAGVQPTECSEAETHPGLGVCVLHDGEEVAVGSEKLMASRGVTIGAEAAAYLRSQGATQSTVLVARSGELLGALKVSDTLRENVREIIEDARRSGAGRIVILTGDRGRLRARSRSGRASTSSSRIYFPPRRSPT
jgi:P-type E1-E2 ATPase